MLTEIDDETYQKIVDETVTMCKFYEMSLFTLEEDFRTGKSSAYKTAVEVDRLRNNLFKKFFTTLNGHLGKAKGIVSQYELLDELPELCANVKKEIGENEVIFDKNAFGIHEGFSFLTRKTPKMPELLDIFKHFPEFDKETEERFLHDPKTIEKYESLVEESKQTHRFVDSSTDSTLVSYMKTWNREKYNEILLQRVDENNFPYMIYTKNLPLSTLDDLVYVATNHPEKFANFLKVNPLSKFWREKKSLLDEKTYDQIIYENPFELDLSEVDLEYMKQKYPDLYEERESLIDYLQVAQHENSPAFMSYIKSRPKKYSSYLKHKLKPEDEYDFSHILTLAEGRSLQRYAPEFLDDFLVKKFEYMVENKKYLVNTNTFEAKYMRENHTELCAKYFVNNYVRHIQIDGFAGYYLPDLKAFSGDIYASTIFKFYEDELEKDSFPKISKSTIQYLSQHSKELFDDFLCRKYDRLIELQKKTEILDGERDYMQENFPEKYQAYRDSFIGKHTDDLTAFYESWKAPMKKLASVLCEIDRSTGMHKNSRLNFFTLTNLTDLEAGRKLVFSLSEIGRARRDDVKYRSLLKDLQAELDKRFRSFDWTEADAKKAYSGLTYKYLKDGEIVEFPLDEKFCEKADRFVKENNLPQCKGTYSEIMRPLAFDEMDGFLFTPDEELPTQTTVKLSYLHNAGRTKK